MSYGDVESSIDETYLFRLDIDLQKFAASGRTVLVAAGDSGVGPCKGDHFEPDWSVHGRLLSADQCPSGQSAALMSQQLVALLLKALLSLSGHQVAVGSQTDTHSLPSRRTQLLLTSSQVWFKAIIFTTNKYLRPSPRHKQV